MRSTRVILVCLVVVGPLGADSASAQQGCESDQATITAQRGIIFDPATGVAPGQYYWKLVDTRWCDEFTSGGKINIFYRCLDENGTQIANQPCIANYGSTNVTIFTKTPPDWGDFPMSGGNWCPAWPEGGHGPYDAWVSGAASDAVRGMGLPCNRHECYFLTWQWSVYSSPTTGAIAGTVENTGGQAISGADVVVQPGSHATASGPSGAYQILNLAPGTYSVTASKVGFNPDTVNNVSVTAGATATVDLTLSTSQAVVSGVIRDDASAPIARASVRLFQGGTMKYGAVTGTDGSYQIIGATPGTYDVTAYAPTKTEETVTGQTLATNGSLVVDFYLSDSGKVVHLIDDFNGAYPGYPPIEESFQGGVLNHFFWRETLAERKLEPHTGSDSAQGFKVATGNDQFLSYFETEDPWTGDHWFNLVQYAAQQGWEQIDLSTPITYLVYVKGFNPGAGPTDTGYYQQFSVHHPSINYENSRVDWNSTNNQTWQMLRVSSPSLLGNTDQWLTLESWYPPFYYNATTQDNWMVWDNLMVEYEPFGTPGPPADFVTKATARRVQLTWTNPSDPYFEGTRIRYKTNGFPAHENDGTFLVDLVGTPGASGAYAHLGAAAGGVYYYSAFSYSPAGKYSAPAMYAALVPGGIPGDYDDDDDVDLADFGHFQECMTGADVPQWENDCADARLDGDLDVDEDDYDVFQSCISGAGVTADINCAN